nr:DUF6065 family protein [uncultured Rhodopila sp.]
MTLPAEPIVRFHQILPVGRPPIRADRAAMGTLPMRAVRYCEAVTSATAFGWWVFSPIDQEFLWDGTAIFWRCADVPDWVPLQPSVQFPDYAAAFDREAPEAMQGCAPPFLTALPEPGCLQIWTGLIAQTAPGWHLLERSMPNLPPAGAIGIFEGIIETDRWFGPLFVNLRFTRSHTPVKIRHDYPLAQVSPVLRECYSNETLDRIVVDTGLSSLSEEDWDGYYATIVEPNARPNRPFGGYATAVRKRRHECQRALEQTAAE